MYSVGSPFLKMLVRTTFITWQVIRLKCFIPFSVELHRGGKEQEKRGKSPEFKLMLVGCP